VRCMDLSSGKSIVSQFEICSGLRAVTHRRSWRRGSLRPFHGAVTYCRSLGRSKWQLRCAPVVDIVARTLKLAL
jgi:hypothetical protein